MINVNSSINRYALKSHYITWSDKNNYLINTPSLCKNKNLKAYKSLEPYNFFASGNVHDVAYHVINNLSEFCFIKTKVIIKGLSFFPSENTFGVFCFNTSQLY